jgi:hypothetical protein
VLEHLVDELGLAVLDELDGLQPRPLDLGAGAGVLDLDQRIVGRDDGFGDHLSLRATRTLDDRLLLIIALLRLSNVLRNVLELLLRRRRSRIWIRG